MTALLSKKNAWVWGASQDTAFGKIKLQLTKVLALYDPAADTKLSADASSYGLGAVLLQKCKSVWLPVAYASRSMTTTEACYAQIEKEALATTWASEKFSSYLIGKHFIIETDHKPLVPLLNSTSLDSLLPRILRFRLRMMRYNYTVTHVPGKYLYTADTLSHTPRQSEDIEDSSTLQMVTEAFVATVVSGLPATPHRLDKFREAKTADPVLSQVSQFCQTSWPSQSNIRPYGAIRSELTICEGLLLRANRMVVPGSMRKCPLKYTGK